MFDRAVSRPALPQRPVPYRSERWFVSQPVNQQLLEGCAALREAGVDVSAAMSADGLNLSPAANPAKAAARQRVDALKADPEWFRKLITGDSEATAEYERLNRGLAG